MSVMPIRLYPDPVLRVHCPEVSAFGDDLRKLAADMIETMHSAVGVGLAASQVGVEARVAVIDVSGGEEDGAPLVLVNPVIENSDPPAPIHRDVEGCLSIPEFTEKVDRPIEIRVHAQDLDGNPVDFVARDLLARVICHEVDHLDGVLFVDHLRGLRKEKARRHLRKMREEAAEATTQERTEEPAEELGK